MSGDSEIADQLRAAIQASGLSHSELGRRVGLDHSQISRFMRGERDMNLRALGRLASTLDLKLVASTAHTVDQAADESHVENTRSGRSGPRRRPETENPTGSSAAPDELELLHAKFREAVNDRLLIKLNEEERIVFQAKQAGCAHQEIAQKIGCTKAEVDLMSRIIVRRLKKLLEKLKEALDSPDS